jgi:AmmeMemoRadiSam system protein B/AmmeMemoRadiSam system protein A
MKTSGTILSDRNPAVAGRFYPSDRAELTAEIIQYNKQAEKLTDKRVTPGDEIVALISPHAGYVFSGTVAASAFKTLHELRNIERVFLLGASHHEWYNGASIYFSGSYITPLGKVRVDEELARRLVDENDEFTYLPDAHKHEHSLEVQLPFLITALGNNFRIVPILIGSHSADTAQKIALILRPYLKPGNLFVISTDLSHYPSYNEALKTDKLTIDALCKNDPEVFLTQLAENEHRKVANLSTSMCGWTAALTLLNMTHTTPDINYHPILYQNSGDTPIYGDKQRVVGYQSVVVTRKSPGIKEDLLIEAEEKKLLLAIARNAITGMLDNRKDLLPEQDTLTENLKKPSGAFVSVYIDKKLRGCIGRIETREPLYQTVHNMAKAAAMHDTRFEPVSVEELNSLSIEISVLSPLKKIDSIKEIIPGKHGILVRKDYRSGTFLPQVAQRTGWNAEEMLQQCSERKAGLGRDGWKEAEIFIYQALVFSDEREE